MLTTTPTKAIQFIKDAYRTRQPIFLHGSPGVGKSDAVRAAADELGIDVIDVRASQLDPVDIRGIPSINEYGQTDWHPPAFLPTSGAGILFADELNTAPSAVQAAFFQLILDRQVGDYTLPEGWIVVAAGNLDTDRSITTRMAPPLRNRFALHLKVEPNIDEWVDWAIENGVHPDIIAYLKWKPQNLYTFDPKRDDFAFATPRSWAFFAKWYEKFSRNFAPYAIGTLGEAVAADFTAFVEIVQQVPNLDDILAGKTVPYDDSDPALNYATAAGLGHRMTPDNAKHALAFLEKHLSAEYTVMTIKYALTRDSQIATTPELMQWLAKNKNLFIQ